MSDYRSAIDLTIEVIRRRSRWFRNQVVSVIAVVAAVIALAVAVGLLATLTTLLTIVPISGLFLWHDNRGVAAWRATILGRWARCEIDLAAFGKAMRANTFLPQLTLESMLALLGSTSDDRAMLPASTPTRQAALAVMRLADELAQQQLAMKVGASAIAAIGVIGATALQAWAPLAVPALALLVLPGILRWRRAAIQRRSREVVSQARREPEFDIGALFGLLESLTLAPAQGPIEQWIGQIGPHTLTPESSAPNITEQAEPPR